MRKIISIILLFTIYNSCAMDSPRQILQKYSAEYQAFSCINESLQHCSFNPTTELHQNFSDIFLPLFTSTENGTISEEIKKRVAKQLKDKFEELSLFYKEPRLAEMVEQATDNAQAYNNAINQKLQPTFDSQKLMNLFDQCKITLQVPARGAKSLLMVDTYFMLPPLGLLQLPEKLYPFTIGLVQSNTTNQKLIKINDQFMEQWRELTSSMQKSLGNLKIDVESCGETIVDKLIRHVPLMLVVAVPNVLNRHSTQIANFMGIYQVLAKTMNFFVGTGAGYVIGQHIFPRLDASFHSHVALLKKYFGKNVRTRIRRGESFLFYAFVATILSHITCTPESFLSIINTQVTIINY